MLICSPSRFLAYSLKNTSSGGKENVQTLQGAFWFPPLFEIITPLPIVSNTTFEWKIHLPSHIFKLFDVYKPAYSDLLWQKWSLQYSLLLESNRAKLEMSQQKRKIPDAVVLCWGECRRGLVKTDTAIGIPQLASSIKLPLMVTFSRIAALPAR